MAGEAKRDFRPEGSAIMESTMLSNWAYAVQLATIAARNGNKAFVDCREKQLRGGQQPVIFHTITVEANGM